MSDAPSYGVSDPAEAVTMLLQACAVMYTMARRALNQDDKRDVGRSHIKETPNLSAVSPCTNLETMPATIQSSPKVVEHEKPEVMQNPVLSLLRLVEEHTNDPELCKLRVQVVSETEAHEVPVCYFKQGNILMWKW